MKAHIRVEFVVVRDPFGRPRDAAHCDTYEEAEQWIDEHTPADLMGAVTYQINKVYTTSRKAKKS